MNSLKEQLEKKTAEELGQAEDLVHTVLAWCFKDVTKAAHVYDAIELSGLGKLMISQNKLRKKIQKWERMLQRIEANPSILDRELKINDLKQDLEFLYSKLQTSVKESEADIRGIQELDTTTRETEGADTGSSNSQAGDM